MRILNNSEREITISANGNNYAIPMAVEGKDVEGNKVLIQGALDIPQEDLETVKDNKVVLYWFNEKMLEVGAEPATAEPATAEPATAEPVTPAAKGK
jgi:hypothetical protein